MNILICKDFNLINDKYDNIFILLEYINFDIFKYLNNKCTVIILNYDILIDSLFLSKLCYKYKILFFNIDNTFIKLFNVTSSLWKDSIKMDNVNLIEYDNNYSFIDNALIEIIQKNKDISNIDIFNYNIICKKKIQELNENITFNINMSEDTIINNKLIFSHIPKNGGTNIEFLSKIYGINWGMHDDNINSNKYILDEYKNKISYDFYHYPLHYYEESIIKDKESFLVVRNPYSKIISNIFCPWGGVFNAHINILNFNKYFESFLIKSFKSNSDNCRNLKQSDFVFKNNEKVINHVLKLENLTNDFNNLMKKFDINIKMENKKINSSKKNFKINNVKTELLFFFNKYYKDDFDNFNYKIKDIQKINLKDYNIIYFIKNSVDYKFLEHLKNIDNIKFISNSKIDSLDESEYLLTNENNIYKVLKNSIKNYKKDNILIFSDIIDISKILIDTNKINYILESNDKYELNNVKLICSNKDNLYELLDSIDEINEESLKKNELKFQLIF